MTLELVRGSLPLVLPGKFKPWSIEPGHSKFLMRGFLGEEESEEPSRIFDVLFQDVSRISLADRYSDLWVSLASPERVKILEQRAGRKWPGSRVFLLTEEDECDYIVAGFLFWAEVTIHARNRSPLLEESPDPRSVKGRIFRA
ncbi:hypothetical protein KQY30_07195 [Streptomyces sp. GMY02]|uniref:hypothetical protein n=1 Tax=Streptomyces sp. GMY02 TaxID=1333528 RepID=UPI001C2CADDD|nr:hypothetical protein [Streptomyces sp. GMY02]QXE34108.1 hypothetical protein KQY30_07195 [Streptomyces sp. GMY02]